METIPEAQQRLQVIEKRSEVNNELRELEAQRDDCNKEIQSLKFGTKAYNKKLFQLRDLVQKVKTKQTELNTLF